MVLKSNKKGQAAIEFLMTYGWMLLVVLIVGALIFSFINFGSLLPNSLNLNNKLKGAPSDSIVFSKDYTNDDEKNEVLVVFTYIGDKQSQISSEGNIITTNLGNECHSYNLTNVGTKVSVGCASSESYSSIEGGASCLDAETTFLNGQKGILRFQCADTPGSNLIKGSTVEGDILIKVKNPETGLEIPSTGDLRLSIGQ